MTLYRIGKVAKWCQQRPSDILDIPRSPSNSSLRFRVDEAVVDFMMWVEGKAQEKKIGTVDQRQPDPRKKQGWVPKYATLGDILAEYARAETEPERPPVDMTEIAALVAQITNDAEPEF